MGSWAGLDDGDACNDKTLHDTRACRQETSGGCFRGLWILVALLATDLRCLDAHAHLGNLLFDGSPGDALRHYEVGVRIAELSLGEAFDAVLPWGRVDNRPFLRCLNGYGLCLWRLGRLDEAARVFDRMLWMNPSDNQGGPRPPPPRGPRWRALGGWRHGRVRRAD